MSPDLEQQVIDATRRWIETAVIGLNLCPFARAVVTADRVRFRVSRAQNAADLHADLRDELRSLAGDTRANVETTALAVLALDAARFASVYDTVGILPPDQYLALVLQATEGCSWNACTFCHLFRGRPFRVKTEAEFGEHIEGVRRFFGDAIALRRSLFLGAANALCVASDRMLPLMESAVRAFPQAAKGGVHAFVDAWAGRRRSAEYGGYAALGLRRVYVGLESGDPQLLSWLRKPGTPEDALSLVEALHESGIAVGVIRPFAPPRRGLR